MGGQLGSEGFEMDGRLVDRWAVWQASWLVDGQVGRLAGNIYVYIYILNIYVYIYIYMYVYFIIIIFKVLLISQISKFFLSLSFRVPTPSLLTSPTAFPVSRIWFSTSGSCPRPCTLTPGTSAIKLFFLGHWCSSGLNAIKLFAAIIYKCSE